MGYGEKPVFRINGANPEGPRAQGRNKWTIQDRKTSRLLGRDPVYLSIPITLGSFVTFIPAGIYALLMIVRTWLEDKTLNKELDGYSDYAKRIRYRLLPEIW